MATVHPPLDSFEPFATERRSRGGRGAMRGARAGDAVLRLDAAGRVTYANVTAAQLLGAESALAVVGVELARLLRSAGLGSAALALQSAIQSARADVDDAEFTVHDALGAPSTRWHVAAQGSGVAIHVRATGSNGSNSAPPAPPSPPDDGDAHSLVALARELAGGAPRVEQALEQLAAASASLLGGDGSCVVTLDESGGARIAAGTGTLASLQGQRTELHEPPSPLHDAIRDRRMIVSELPGGAKRALVAPLIVGDAVAAALCVVSTREFSARDRALAERLAEHGALALRNHRLHQAVERSARDARLLADAAHALARHVTPDTLYPALARIVREALGASGFTVTLADPTTGHVERLYSEGAGATVVAAVPASRFWETACGAVVRDARPVFTDGTLPAVPTELDHAIDRVLRDSAVRRMALLPLVDGETHGVLALQFAERRQFDDAERRLLGDFAAYVAVAVRNVGLFVARERERDVAAAAAEIARVALDADSLEVGATAMLALLDRVVPSDGKALSVLREDAGSLDCAGATGSLAFMRGMRAPRTVRALRPPVDGHVAPVIVADLRTVLTRERCPEAADHPAVAASAAMIPLVARGRAIGDLALTTALGSPLAATARDALRRLAAPIALGLDALLLADERRRRLTEERQMTAQLRQAEKMAALGELVAGVAHEINNPLTGISAFAELLLDDPLESEQRDSVRLIKREADRAVAVVRDLLVFSRKTEPAYEAVDLNALTERTLRLRAYAMRATGIDVVTSFDATLPVVYGDEAKLQQVVLNLLLNAEHAMRDANTQRLTLVTRREGIGDRTRIVLAIGDSGAGISPEVMPRIFEPFFTTKPAGEGTGLGLSVSYGIVHAHGGELRAHSRLGVGTTFELALPLPPNDA